MRSARELILFLVYSPVVLGQQGDMLERPQSAFTAPTPARLWTNNTVPYVVDADIPNPARFNDAATFYNQNTPVKWQARNGEANFVHLVRSTIGNGVCTSSVGMITGEQFIHVEDACNTATLIHEMGHTVGFFHEQSRSDRNRNVTVLYENIDKTAYNDFQIGGLPNEQDVGAYEYASRMHYASFLFSVDALPTIQTVPAGIPVDTYTVLSPGDLDTLFRMYGQPPTKTTVTTNPPGLAMTVDGQASMAPQVFDWAAGSKHTIAVAGQTNANNRDLFAKWSDGGAASHTVTSDAAVTLYTANFVQQVQVKVSVSAGQGTVALDVTSPDGYFAGQTPITMTATPAPGWEFQRWNGGTACPRTNGASPTTFVTAASNISCTATFTQSPLTTIVTEPLNLPVTVDGLSYLTTPVHLIWNAGTSHTISTAAPASTAVSPVRYIFQGWSDGGVPSHTVTAVAVASTVKV